MDLIYITKVIMRTYAIKHKSYSKISKRSDERLKFALFSPLVPNASESSSF